MPNPPYKEIQKNYAFYSYNFYVGNNHNLFPSPRPDGHPSPKFGRGEGGEGNVLRNNRFIVLIFGTIPNPQSPIPNSLNLKFPSDCEYLGAYDRDRQEFPTKGREHRT